LTLLSIDGNNSPEIVSAIATSAALAVSTIPWNGPISTMKIGYVPPAEEGTEGNLILNPIESEQTFSTLSLIVSSSKDKVIMIETEAMIVKDEIVQEGIEMAKKENAKVIDFIENLVKKIGKPKSTAPDEISDHEVLNIIKKTYSQELDKAVKEIAETAGSDSHLLTEIIDKIYGEIEKKFDKKQILNIINKYNYAKIKSNLVEKKIRPDGRKLDEVRKLFIEVSLLPRTHGSALFQRGQTQVLSIVTLGSTTLEQLIEGPEGKEAKRYIHHYSDGPYSYGQTGRMFGPSRRAIGHGALAEKAIEAVLPNIKDFPYAVRVVSEILSENGSSSMGCVCGSSLALMDAGVPLKASVAGVAMGMASKSDDEYVIMTDIVGLEDFAGEMDFKVAGTVDGITAIQLDVKNKGLTAKMIKDIFEQAKTARLNILEEMNKVISKPKKEISK
jgi:polyribonucleotide nucleotidyltransferase